MTKEEIVKALTGVSSTTVEEVLKGINESLRGKGLSFREAEAVLEVAKDLLKNAKIN